MLQSLYQAASKNPFANPFVRARCEPLNDVNTKVLVPGRTIGAANGNDSCEFGSLKFYLLCAVGGSISCGSTHLAIVSLDVVKCRLQVDAEKYQSLITGIKITLDEEGAKGLIKGWAPTLIGYSMQGTLRFSLYEYFKIKYANIVGPEIAYLWRTTMYIAAAGTAEFFADFVLSPWEAVKVRMQTMPGFTSSMKEAIPIMYAEEGLNAFYKGLAPLWGRQVPYTMTKFACFERTMEALYKYVVPRPREQCSKATQLFVTFTAGYIAGVLCAIVSHPADTIISQLNKEKGSTAAEIAKKLGWKGVWNGLGTRIIMIGTIAGFQWFIYDGVKVMLGIPRPPAAVMPESLRKKSKKEG